MHNQISESLFFYLQVVDFCYHSLMQEIFFRLGALIFHVLCGSDKNVKISDKYCCLFITYVQYRYWYW